MLRTTAAIRAAARPALRTPAVQRRAASSTTESVKQAAEGASQTVKQATDKVKDAADHMTPKTGGSDVPWAIGSLLVFAPLLFYMTSPPAVNKDTHHLPAPKEKFKPHLRLPAETEAHQPIPENTPDNVGDKAGEGKPHGQGDHGLRAEVEHNDDVVKKQNNPEPAESASNHDAKGGLKGDSGKFNAAARMSQQLNQQAGGEGARDMKAVNKAIRQASADSDDGSPGAHKDYSTPETTGKRAGEALTEGKEKKSAEDDEKAMDKDEQT